MSSSKKKTTHLEEYKKAKFLDSPKEIRSSLLKIREQLQDLPFLVEVIEIDIILNSGFIKEAYERSQTLYDAMNQATDQSIEFKELKNIAGYLASLSSLEYKQDDDTLKILLNIKDEPTNDEVVTALRAVFSGMYIEIRGLISKSYLKAKDYKNALTASTELFSHVKNFKQVIDSMDAKSLFRVEKLLLIAPQVAFEQGEYTESISKLREMLELNKTIKIHPKFQVAIQRELAKLLARAPLPETTPSMNFPRNAFEESIKILFSLAQDATFDESIFDDIILLMANRRHYNLLADLLKSSLIKNFSNITLWTQLGLALTTANRHHEAILVFQECLLLNPNNAKISLLMAQVYLNHLNAPRKAVESLSRFNEYGPFWQTKCHYYLGVIHSQLALKETSLQGRKKEYLLSLEHLAKAAEMDPNDPMINFYIALQYAEMRETKKAFHYVRLSLGVHSHVSGWILLALLFSSCKEYVNVGETIKTALTDFPNNYSLLLLQSEFEEVESEAKAFKSYKSILEMMESHPISDKKEENEVLFRIANAYRRMKRIPETIEVMKKKTHPWLESEFHFLNGRIFEDTKKITEAIEVYETTLIKDASHVGAQERLAIIYATQQNYVLSRSFLSSAVRLDPTNFECWYQLGSILKKLGDLEEASDCFITSVQLSTTAPLVPYEIIKRKI